MNWQRLFARRAAEFAAGNLRCGAVIMAAALVCSCSTESSARPGGRAAPRAPAVILVGKDQPPCPILIRPKAPRDENLAAKQLAAYLKQISGATFSVKTAPEPLPDRAILVGPLGVRLPADLGEEGYVIRTRGKVLLIAGGSPRGTLYGVYGFLEDVLGCRWWSHTEEFVPKKAVIALRKLNITARPAFSLHNLYNREAQHGKNYFAYKRRATSPERFTGGHNLCPDLRPYAKKNPQFLPMGKNGKRKFNNLHMSYVAPGMSEALAEVIEKKLKRHKGEVKHNIYFEGMGDWYGGMCMSPESKKIYAEETWTDPDGRKKPGYIAPLLRMLNKTAEILEKKYPGIRVGTFAYMSLEAPPAKTVPRHNVVLRIPHLRHCIVHGVSECKKNRSFLLNLKRWGELAPNRVYIWDYGINFGNFMYPFPNIKAIARNIKAYKKLGVRGVMIQGNYVSMGSDLIVLRNYVWGKLLWNPALDVDKLIEEFCLGYYGPAGKEMLAYVNALEDSVRTPKHIHLNEFERKLKKHYLTDELEARLNQTLRRAVARTRGRDPYLRRVKEAMVSLEAFNLWKPGPLKEQGDRLVRADLGDTWQRAQDMVKYSRKASPREWGDGRAYRMGFLALHGGPLPTLKRGPLEVKIAPILNGRIRRIIYRGKDVLHIPNFARKESPNSSGAYENLSPGARIYRLVGKATPTAATCEAELGIAHWGSRTRQIARKTVELTEDGKIRITGAARRVLRNQKAIRASVVTEYAAGKDISQVSVRLKAKGGTWKVVAVPSGKPDPKKVKPNLPPISALKVILSNKGLAVLDSYLAPATTGGYIWFDAKRGVLVTQVNLSRVEVPPKGESQYLLRELEVTAK